MEVKKLPDHGLDPFNNKRITVPITPFESRGSRMLRAALNNQPPVKERGPISVDVFSGANTRTDQQVEELKNRKRSPKNNVLFREPVVTEEYEYEPTYLVEANEHKQTNGLHGAQEMALVEAQTHEIHQVVNSASTNDHFKDNKTSNGFGTPANEHDDDDDDDLFTMASSDSNEAFDNKLIEHAKNASKRSYESIKDSDDEHCAEEQVRKTDSGGGGLFSSPKVAKIAPYFDERPRERRAAEVRFMQQNRLRAQQQSYLRSRSTSSREHITNNKSGISMSGRRKPASFSNKCNDRVTELISYKKVSSPKIGDRNVISAPPEPTKLRSETSCTSEQCSTSYFGWFTSFITNQMNKLIF